MPMLLRTKRFWPALLLAVAAIVALPLLTNPPKAAAHPLGNFTINHYSRIELGPDILHVRYVLDMAEIPAFQERDAIDSNGDGSFTETEKSAYLTDKVEDLRHDLDLKLDGAPVELSALESNLSFPPGQGGLDTQRIEIDFTGPVAHAAAAHTLEYHDNSYSDRIGWREVVVRGLDGVRIANSSATAQDVSDELRAYPQDSISNPLDVTSASVSYSVLPGAVAAPPPKTSSSQAQQHERAVRGNPDSTLARYAGLIAKDRLSASVVIFALLAAVGFGAVHALSAGARQDDRRRLRCWFSRHLATRTAPRAHGYSHAHVQASTCSASSHSICRSTSCRRTSIHGSASVRAPLSSRWASG